VHPFLISNTLSQITYVDIKEIKKIGRGKVLVDMNSAKAANKLTNNARLAQEGLKAFILAYRILRTGIVKDIPYP